MQDKILDKINVEYVYKMIEEIIGKNMSCSSCSV